MLFDSNNKSIKKEYRIHQVIRGKELFSLLNIRNLTPNEIKFDYSTNIEGAENMELVINTFEKIKKSSLIIEGEQEKPSRDVFDFHFAPALAELNKRNIGIFAKRFCTIQRGNMTLEEFESQLYADDSSPWRKSADSDKVKNTLLIIGHPLSKLKDIPFIDGFDTKMHYLNISEKYVKEKLGEVHGLYNVKEIVVDEDDSNDKSILRALQINDMSSNLGYIEYLKEKEKEDPLYYKKFEENPYFDIIIENLEYRYEEFLWGDYSIDEDGIAIRTEKKYKKNEIDEKSYLSGQKQAAISWHAWNIFNKRAPYVQNDDIDFLRNYHPFPNVNHKLWKGPDNTNTKVYIYKGQEQITIYNDLPWPRGAIYIAEDGEKIDIESWIWDQENRHFIWNDQIIKSNAEYIIHYSDKKNEEEDKEDDLSQPF